jgi:hypothetical protein
MDYKCIRPTLIAAALVAAGYGPTVLAEQKTGSETVVLTQVYGVAMNGSRDPAADGACKAKYGGYLGQKITTKYDINTQTLIMTATSDVFGTPVLLHPMGISTSWSFMSDGVPKALEAKGVERVIFSMTLDFKNPESDIMGTLDAKDNCVLSNLAP